MKETVKTSRVAGYLEKMYRQLNADKFNNELEECIITIQNTPGAYGHVTCARVWKSKDCSRYELNIGASTLDRPIENVVSTLLHEMVHIYNLMNDIQDCSRNGTYHNRKFKEKAESVGLIIDKDNKYGWTITSPSESLIDYICAQGWEDIQLNRGFSFGASAPKGKTTNTDQDEDTATPIRKPSSTRKYQCPLCKNSVRATKSVNIKCMDCNAQMQVVDK